MAKEALAENQVRFTQTIRHGCNCCEKIIRMNNIATYYCNLIIKAFSIFKARFLAYFPSCRSSVFE